jgi:hypothetical protein
MITLAFGVVLTVLAGAFFYFSLPKEGRTARFVGSEWEGYVVVAYICIFGLGVLLLVNGAAQMIAT